MPDEVNTIVLAREDKRIGVQCEENSNTARVPERGLEPPPALASLVGGAGEIRISDRFRGPESSVFCPGHRIGTL